MFIEKDYYNLSEVADRYQISIDDLLHLAVKGLIDIATYIDFNNINQIKPYPIDTKNVPLFNSGLYYIYKKDIIKFQFNSGNDSITINHIFPNPLPLFDYDFPSPCAEDDFLSYPESHWVDDEDRPLLCLEINNYTIYVNNLVICSHEIEFLDSVNNKKLLHKSEENTSLSTMNNSAAEEALLAERGRKFISGCQSGRTDNLLKALSFVVESYCAKHPGSNRLPFKGIIEEMEKLIKTNDIVRKIVIEIDDEAEEVSWKRQNGREAKTGYKRINDRLGYFRKNFKM